MKHEREVWTCDFCGVEQTFEKKTFGASYFSGWVVVKVMSSEGPGVFSSGDFGERCYCCIDHAVKGLNSYRSE